ncbi:uncharacterized protein B0I36DRAFT_350523 [Microdochium trichocladiopsis]|uniref:Uncharacterized protein n=1 Tax=Microdochium trichocladiopsis TaxID=1682393 RepID=A0A9P9BQ04_9PEZI|nr:uncharacterized protein B0I36DRAFT_350523 [Microdochium trichocladiopsis]KAH7029695.1 hypothetical protein B0I36DRAFT_350523 [Microdochium trichocladiopsis]
MAPSDLCCTPLEADRPCRVQLQNDDNEVPCEKRQHTQSGPEQSYKRQQRQQQSPSAILAAGPSPLSPQDLALLIQRLKEPREFCDSLETLTRVATAGPGDDCAGDSFSEGQPSAAKETEGQWKAESEEERDSVAEDIIALCNADALHSRDMSKLRSQNPGDYRDFLAWETDRVEMRAPPPLKTKKDVKLKCGCKPAGVVGC